MTDMQSKSSEPLPMPELADDLALLHMLEASLRASQAALLSRDLNGLKRSTDEQKRLYRELRALGPPPAPCPLAEGFAIMKPTGDPQRASQLREAQVRILQMGRLQAALLARVQRALTVSANRMAGTATNYGPARMQFAPMTRYFSDAREG
jgi:hypothetical protein